MFSIDFVIIKVTQQVITKQVIRFKFDCLYEFKFDQSVITMFIYVYNQFIYVYM